MSELVTDYLDRALPWRMRVQARLHLFVCHACRRYFEQMRRTVRFLAGGPWQAPPVDVEERVLRVIAERASGDEG